MLQEIAGSNKVLAGCLRGICNACTRLQGYKSSLRTCTGTCLDLTRYLQGTGTYNDDDSTPT